MSAFEYVEPASADEVLYLLAEGDDGTHVLAGGAALVPLMKTGYVRPTRLVALRRLAGLCSIEVTEAGLSIGSMARLADIAKSPLVRDGWPLLATACSLVGTPRIRNQATIGGNVAHADPSQDPPPALMVLEASARVRGRDSERRIPLSELFVDYFETELAPSELLLGLDVPPLPPGARTAYNKFLSRSRDDYATVSVAAMVVVQPDGHLGDVRIALGGAAPRPIRIRGVEAALRDRRPTPDLLREAATLAVDEMDPIEDVRGSATYKRAMAVVTVERTIGDLCGVPVA